MLNVVAVYVPRIPNEVTHGSSLNVFSDAICDELLDAGKEVAEEGLLKVLIARLAKKGVVKGLVQVRTSLTVNRT
jgi:hypothetical protein